MDKKKINNRVFAFLFVMFMTNVSYSQELFTKEMEWFNTDSVTKTVFQNTNEIVEWGKNRGTYVSVDSLKCTLNDKKVFILMVDLCSGLYCPVIYVFVEKNKLWHLTTRSTSRLQERMEIETKKNKIVFKTKSDQIGELTFERINAGF